MTGKVALIRQFCCMNKKNFCTSTYSIMYSSTVYEYAQNSNYCMLFLSKTAAPSPYDRRELEEHDFGKLVAELAWSARENRISARVESCYFIYNNIIYI